MQNPNFTQLSITSIIYLAAQVNIYKVYNEAVYFGDVV